MPLIHTHQPPPRTLHTFGVLTSAGAVSTSVDRSAGALPIVLRRDLATHPTEMNPLKGFFGENVVGRLLRQRSGAAIEWIEPVRRGGQGIDMLCIERTGEGFAICVRVYEVKFGTSRLGYTRDGKQLSELWTRRRLRENAIQLRAQATKATCKAVARTARRQAEDLFRAANGDCLTARNVVRVTTHGAQFRISIEDRCGQSSNVIASGKFQQLPLWARRSIRGSFEETFRNHGCSPEDARRLTREACRNPDFFRGMSRERRWTWRAGLDRHSVHIVLGAATLAAGLRALCDLWAHGRVDWQEVALSGLLGGSAGFLGKYAGIQTVAVLTATQYGRDLAASFISYPIAQFGSVVGMGRFVGGLVGALAFAYGGALLGLSDWRSANRTMTSAALGIGGGFGATSATLGIAVMVGTSGTGTAISTLSGAAMTNAALAWIGGGTVASGGGGMFVGSLILSGIGAVIVCVGGVAMNRVYCWLDERERVAMIHGRIELARLALSP